MSKTPSSSDGPSFAELFEASLQAAPVRFEVGQQVKGKLLQFGKEWSFLDIGAKGEALIATSELMEKSGEPAVALGAVVEARVEGQDADFALTKLSFAGGHLVVPQLDLPRGAELRLRIRARDVSLALSRPESTSILNALPCIVRDISAEEGPQVDLRLDAGGAALWARITRRSQHELGLAPGSQVYALIKAVAIDRYSLGRGAGTGRFFPDTE